MNDQYPSLTIDVMKCTGCMACELICSYVKENVYSPTLSRIHVMQVYDYGVSVPIVCNNCEEAPCIELLSHGGDYSGCRIGYCSG